MVYENFNKMITDDLDPSLDNIADETKISKEDYEKWSKEISQIIIPEEVYKVIDVIRKKIQDYNNKLEKEQTEIYISDRRWRKIVRILRTSAFLNDRIEVDLMDCFLIQYCIWNEESEIETVKDITANAIRNFGYSLTIDIEGVREQIKEKKAEVEEESQNIKLVEKKRFKLYHKKYYKIQGIINYSDYCLIEKSDYQKIRQDIQAFYLYTEDLSNSRNTNVIFQNKLLRVQDHSWSDCEIETELFEEQKKETRRPSDKLIKVWDDEISKIIQEIENQISTIEKHRTEKLEHLQTNLFVDRILSNIVEENLHNSVHELQDLKLEVEKIKDYYDGLE